MDDGGHLVDGDDYGHDGGHDDGGHDDGGHLQQQLLALLQLLARGLF